MVRAAPLLIVFVILTGCTDHAAKAPAKRGELPATLMRQMLEPAKLCIESYRGRVPDPYFASIRLARSAGGLIALSFESHDQADFNACVVDAIEKARLPAGDLQSPVVVQFAFSFAPHS